MPLKPDVCLMGYQCADRAKPAARCFPPPNRAAKMQRSHERAAVIKALARYPIDVLTHRGIRARGYAPRCGSRGKAAVIEPNNKHPLRGEDIAIALDKGAFFIISSDAHVPQNVGVVERAAGEARLAKIPKERIVNSGAYGFDRGLADRQVSEWASELAHFSTGQNDRPPTIDRRSRQISTDICVFYDGFAPEFHVTSTFSTVKSCG